MKNFIKQLLDLDIHLRVDKGNIKINHNGNLTEEIKTKIKAHKADLITYLLVNNQIDEEESVKVIPKVERANSYPLSSGQYRLWLTSRMVEDSSVYNMYGHIQLNNFSDINVFRKAILATIERHEILRTVFKEDRKGKIRQWIVPFEEFDFDIKCLNFINSDREETSVGDYIEKDIYKPFDLENGPLLRLTIFQLSEGNNVFYYNMHHIISDGWSINVLIKDVTVFYEAFKSEKKPNLPELKIQYKDYANWQILQLENGAYQAHKNYWKQQFSTIPSLLNLPSSKIRPKFKTSNGKLLSTTISSDVTKKVNGVFKKNGGSLFMGLVTIMKVLIYRYTHEKDITIGSPIAGRHHEDLENQIGFYVNTMALRTEIDSTKTLISFFNQVKESILNAYNHQVYPFDSLVQDLNLKRDASRSPLFDFSIVIENDTLKSRNEIEEDQEEIRDAGKYMVQNDVVCVFREKEETLDFSVAYNTDVYDEGIMRQFIQHYKELLSNLSDNLEVEISKINLLTKVEKERFLNIYNKKDSDFDSPKSKTVLDLFKERTLENPNAIALVFEDKKMTYQELDETSNQLANYLIKHGVDLETMVPVCVDRSLEMIISILAVMKAGGAYVPIDINYPKQRIDFIIKDVNPKLILTFSKYETLITKKEETTTFVFLDDLYDLVKFESKGTVNSTVDSNNLINIIYTSGTTGVPKGVLCEHKGVLNLTVAQIKEMGLTRNDCTLQFASFSFDAFTSEVFTTLGSGASLVLTSNEVIKSKESIVDLIQKESITVVTLPPSYQVVLDDGLATLRVIISAGEAIHIEQTRVLQGYGVKVINGYGPTENTVCSTMSSDPVSDFSTTIGKPLNNVQVYILDFNLQLVPSGVIGEICVSGDQIVRGYLNRPELTKEKFISHPFKKGEKLYKTGDLGRWLSDGDIEFIGRADNQIKIRGFRIELDGVENVLNNISSVSHGVVLVAKNEEGEKGLVAYVKSNEKFDKDRIKSQMLSVLPEYMVPSMIFELQEFPLTSNGKVDKKSLQNILIENVQDVEHIPPQTKEEKDLVHILETVLKSKNIGIKDNFYNLGGDSIKSILVLSRLKQKGYMLNAEIVMKNPIVEDLAKHMVITDFKQVDQKEVAGKSSFTPIQQYFFNSIAIKNPHHFNQSVVLKSTKEIDHDVVDQCLQILVNHHDALRMVYKNKNLRWEQYNQDTSGKHYEINFYNLEDSKDPFDEMSKLGDEIQKSFRIDEGPLVKITHFRFKNEDHLALIIHHLVVDGFSWRILLEDLATLYDQIKSGSQVNLPLKTDSFKHWALLQNEYANGKKIEDEKSYWDELFKEEIPDIPHKNTVRSKVSNKQKELTFTLSNSITNLLQTKFHQVYNTQINETLLTGLSLALQNTFGLDKYVVEMEGHGREKIINDIDISRTIGWFTSVYPIILDISKSKDNKDALVELKETLRKIPNNGIGYGMLKYLRNSFSNEIKPSIRFNYLGDFGNKVGNSENSIFEYSSEDIGADLDEVNKENRMLNISGIMVQGKLQISITYPVDLYEEIVIEKLMEEFEKELSKLIVDVSNEETQYITPYDVTFKNLSIGQLNKVNKDNNIEDIYKLSPLQEGIYFTWLSKVSNEFYFEQIHYRLKNVELEILNVEKAYEQLIDRHPILRTSFTNNLSDTPLQIVWKKAPYHFEYECLSDKNLKTDERKIYVEKVKREDVMLGFDMEKPSQMRLRIINFGNNEYEFIWSHHHILMDGWCMGLLINDFYQILSNLTSDNPIELKKPIKYSNYIEWLNTIDQEASLNYWRTYLSGYSEKTGIPYTKGNDSEKAYEEKKEILEIKGELFDKIADLCKELGITQNIFVQGIWGYLLSKYNDTQDVVFGLVVSGRPTDIVNVQEILGLFINTIPVRSRYRLEDSPSELLTQMHNEALNTNLHHYVNFSKVVSQSELGANLIDHVLVFKDFLRRKVNEEYEQNSFGTLVIEDIETFERNNFEYNIEVIPTSNSIRIDINYNKNKFDKSFIRTIFEHLKNTAIHFVTDPYKPLKNINYISSAENETIIDDLKGEVVNLEKRSTVVDQFIEQANSTPNAIALSFGNKEISYKKLQEATSAFALFLREEYQIKTGDYVGVYLDHSDWMVVAVLGIIRAGAIFVPINTKLPMERKSFMTKETNMSLLVTETAYMFDLDFYEGNSTAIDVEFDPIQNTDVSQLDFPAHSDLAYAIYTSGSTGLPKGVAISHKSLSNYLTWAKSEYLTNDLSNFNFGLFTSLSFDLTITSLFLPLISGGRLFVFDTKQELKDIFKEYLDSDISCIKLTPAHITLLRNIDITLDKKHVQLAIVGGDTLHANHVNVLKNLNANIKIYNEYGPTEATVGCIVSQVDEKEKITIGRPIANTQIYIMDQNGQILPKGIKGEICIGGDGLSLGYLNRKALTEQKFVDNPIVIGEKIYKTGDLGRLELDGNISYEGRIDDQIKINGYRIELGEIQNILQSKDSINSVIISAKHIHEDQLKLVAYFTAEINENPEDLRAYMSKKLPEYMIPNYFIQLERFPLNVNGKIDKKNLPDPSGELLFGNKNYVAPSNNYETRMVDLLAQLTGIETKDISIEANFFDLGINSLELMKMENLINNEFQTNIQITQLFEYSNIKDLVRNVFDEQNEEEKNEEEIDLSTEVDEVLNDFL